LPAAVPSAFHRRAVLSAEPVRISAPSAEKRIDVDRVAVALELGGALPVARSTILTTLPAAA
jgi:hypothetical protein